MKDYDRLSVLTGALLLMLTLSRFLETPASPLLSTTILGSPLGVALSASGLMMLLTLGMTITAMSSLLQERSRTDDETNHYFMYWMVPALLNLALVTWLGRIENVRIWSAGMLVAAAIIPSAMMVEYQALGRENQDSEPLPWGQVAIVYLSAALLFTHIFDARIRSLLSATAVGLIGTALSSRLLWARTKNLSQAFRYGAVVGLILGQMTWGLNYWRLSGLQGGLLLLMVFHIAAGLVQQWSNGRLMSSDASRRVLLEYGAVVIVALIVIVAAGS